MQNRLITLEKLFLALADKTRLKLLSLMADGEVSVGYLTDQLGESQPKVSRHLAYLRSAGLVSTRRDGKWIYYAVDDQADRGTQYVLNAVLQAIDMTTPADRSPSRKDYRVAPVAVSRFKNEDIHIHEDADESELQPELPIYLL